MSFWAHKYGNQISLCIFMFRKGTVDHGLVFVGGEFADARDNKGWYEVGKVVVVWTG